MMQLNRKEFRLMNQLLNFWVSNGLLSEELSGHLRQSVKEKESGWQLLARYAFYCMVCSGVLAIVAVLMDDKLIAFLLELLNASAWLKSVGFFVAALVAFTAGYRASKTVPDRIYGRESLYFLGVILVAAADWFLGKALDTSSSHYSVLLLLAFFIYTAFGLALSSRTVWMFALVALCWWFIAETDYQAGDSLHYYGMNAPVRFSLFSAMLLASSYILLLGSVSRPLFFMTKGTGVLCLFTGLWGVAVVGNYGSFISWSEVSQFEIWQWKIPLGLVCVLSIWVGARWGDDLYRQVGIVFFILLIYTLFCEYVWDAMHKALFFTLLGFSFWVLSRFAEQILLSKPSP